MTRFLQICAAAVLASGLTASTVRSQALPGCAETQLSDPDRTVLTCEGGLVIEVEAAAQLGPGEGDVRSFTLDAGAALVEVEPGAGPQQIRTPHAIAAVRGTVYAVDVGTDSTSVFVQEGQVTVLPAAGDAAGVELGEGEGVDVSPGEPLVVRSWGAARIAELLARFGR